LGKTLGHRGFDHGWFTATAERLVYVRFSRSQTRTNLFGHAAAEDVRTRL
jgi:hypothetical protein